MRGGVGEADPGCEAMREGDHEEGEAVDAELRRLPEELVRRLREKVRMKLDKKCFGFCL